MSTSTPDERAGISPPFVCGGRRWRQYGCGHHQLTMTSNQYPHAGSHWDAWRYRLEALSHAAGIDVAAADVGVHQAGVSRREAIAAGKIDTMLCAARHLVDSEAKKQAAHGGKLSVADRAAASASISVLQSAMWRHGCMYATATCLVVLCAPPHDSLCHRRASCLPRGCCGV